MKSTNLTKRLLIAAALLGSPLAAQQPPQATPEQLTQLILSVRQQRDANADAAAQLAAQLQAVTAENDALKKQVADLQKQLEAAKPTAPTKPNPDSK